MRGMRRMLLAAVLALAACGPTASQGPTTNHATASGNGSGSDLICHEEAATGSTLSHEVCRTREQVDDDRKGADEMLRTQGSRPGSPN